MKKACTVVFLPIQRIAFLTFSLTSPSWYLKKISLKSGRRSISPILFEGRRRLCRGYKLGQEKENLDSPPYPQLANQGWANSTFWLSRTFQSSLISWRGLLFHFILSIVLKPCRGVLPGILGGLCRLILQKGRPTLSQHYLSNFWWSTHLAPPVRPAHFFVYILRRVTIVNAFKPLIDPVTF